MAKEKKYTQVIPVDDNTKKAFMNYCEGSFLGQGAAIKKWMTELGFLDKNGSLKDK